MIATDPGFEIRADVFTRAEMSASLDDWVPGIGVGGIHDRLMDTV